MSGPNSYDIIGLDLGHGETAVARVRADNDAEPEILEINGRKTQLTAIGRHASMGVLIGERALMADDVTQLEICFKGRPSKDPLYRRNMREYIAACYQHLVDSMQIRAGDGAIVYVGCPSGWSDETLADYEALLAESGIQRLSCARESRAALLHSKENGRLTVGELLKPVLIIDIGSSTTDFTLVRAARESPLDYGDDLGAALIDTAILEATLASHEREGVLREIFDKYPLYRNRCEMQCRKAKEAYFNDEQIFDEETSRTRAGYERIQDVCIFEPSVNGPIMRGILSKPLASLEGCSWRGRFEELLEKVHAELSIEKLVPSVVLLTGGASRMGFVTRSCQDAFPSADIRRDPEPEFCIARGLARWGRMEVRTRQFLKEVEEFLGEELPALVDSQIHFLQGQLSRPLAADLTNAVCRRGCEDWRRGSVETFEKLEKHMKHLGEEWAKSHTVADVVANTLKTWFAPISNEINTRLGVICRRHGMPSGTLNIHAKLDAAAMNTPTLGSVLEGTSYTGMSIATIVAGLIVASLFGGGGTALLFAGPLGWFIGLVAGGAAGIFGYEKVERAAKEQVRQLNIPKTLRTVLMSDATIDKKCQQVEPKLEVELREQLGQMDAKFEEIGRALREQLEQELQSKADEARLLIG